MTQSHMNAPLCGLTTCFLRQKLGPCRLLPYTTSRFDCSLHIGIFIPTGTQRCNVQLFLLSVSMG